MGSRGSMASGCQGLGGEAWMWDLREQRGLCSPLLCRGEVWWGLCTTVGLLRCPPELSALGGWAGKVRCWLRPSGGSKGCSLGEAPWSSGGGRGAQPQGP